MKRRSLGLVTVDAGDVVVFSYDKVMKLAERLGYDPLDGTDDMIEDFDGVPCEFGCDGIYGVDEVTVKDSAGNEYAAVLIGGPEGDVTLT